MHGRLQALQLLVRQIAARREVTGFLNSKDNHGFTLLHLAVYNQHIEIVQYLLSLRIEVNALDSKGLTPLDMLTNYPTVYPNLTRTANFLRGHGAICSSTINSMTSSEIWARKKDALMVVASLIATLNPPGGVWQEDNTKSNTTSSLDSGRQIAGRSIMAMKNPILYVSFITFASLAFMFSIIELLLNMSNTISNSGVVSEILLLYAKYISAVSLVSGREVVSVWTSLCVTASIILLFLFFALRHGFVGRPSALRPLIQFPPPI